MRLIDADELIKRIADMRWKSTDDVNVIEIIGMKYSNSMNDMVLDLIRRTPTAYDIDKVVEELEEIKAKYSKLSCSVNNTSMVREYIAKEQSIALAIEIVKRGGE